LALTPDGARGDQMWLQKNPANLSKTDRRPSKTDRRPSKLIARKSRAPKGDQQKNFQLFPPKNRSPPSQNSKTKIFSGV
jgi:hypothetical protein